MSKTSLMTNVCLSSGKEKGRFSVEWSGFIHDRRLVMISFFICLLSYCYWWHSVWCLLFHENTPVLWTSVRASVHVFHWKICMTMFINSISSDTICTNVCSASLYSTIVSRHIHTLLFPFGCWFHVKPNIYGWWRGRYVCEKVIPFVEKMATQIDTGVMKSREHLEDCHSFFTTFICHHEMQSHCVRINVSYRRLPFACHAIPLLL